jgi:hypothetical protein
LLAQVSNQHLELQPVFAALAREAGLSIYERRDVSISEAELAAGKNASEWVIMGAPPEEIARLQAKSPQWRALTAPPTQAVWTDDFTNVLGAIRF